MMLLYDTWIQTKKNVSTHTQCKEKNVITHTHTHTHTHRTRTHTRTHTHITRASAHKTKQNSPSHTHTATHTHTRSHTHTHTYTHSHTYLLGEDGAAALLALLALPLLPEDPPAAAQHAHGKEQREDRKRGRAHQQPNVAGREAGHADRKRTRGTIARSTAVYPEARVAPLRSYSVLRPLCPRAGDSRAATTAAEGAADAEKRLQSINKALESEQARRPEADSGTGDHGGPRAGAIRAERKTAREKGKGKERKGREKRRERKRRGSILPPFVPSLSFALSSLRV